MIFKNFIYEKDSFLDYIISNRGRFNGTDEEFEEHIEDVVSNYKPKTITITTSQLREYKAKLN